MQQRDIAVLAAMKEDQEYTANLLADCTGIEPKRVRSALRLAVRGG